MIGVWSVANAATYVKRFLLANKADGVTYRFPDVSGAMAEVDSTLRTAAAAGDEDADLACRCLADIWYNISVAWERNQRSMEMMDSKIPISTEDRMALRIAERLLDASAAEYPPERRDRIRELIADVPGLLKTVTLPKELKEYVARLVREVGTALDEYDLTGDFKLDIAFTRLQTSLNIIAATPQRREITANSDGVFAEACVPLRCSRRFRVGVLCRFRDGTGVSGLFSCPD